MDVGASDNIATIEKKSPTYEEPENLPYKKRRAQDSARIDEFEAEAKAIIEQMPTFNMKKITLG